MILDKLNKFIRERNNELNNIDNLTTLFTVITVELIHLAEPAKYKEIIENNLYDGLYKINVEANYELNKVTFRLEKENKQIGSSIVYDHINKECYLAGGRVDSICANVGFNNTEWVLRDDQLQSLIDRAIHSKSKIDGPVLIRCGD